MAPARVNRDVRKCGSGVSHKMLRWHVPVAIFLLTLVGMGAGAMHKKGGEMSSALSDAAGAARGDCPPAQALAQQYHAALLYLRAEGVRSILLLRRRQERCDVPVAILRSLLRATGMKSLGEPLVVGRAADWERLARHRKQAAADVAVLATDGDLLEEAVRRKEAAWWREATWFAPGIDLNSAEEKLPFDSEWKIITTKVADPRQEVLSDEIEGSEKPTVYFDLGIRDIFYKWNSTGEPLPGEQAVPHQQTSNSKTATLPVLLARWAPLPVTESPWLQVFRASPWLLAGAYREGGTGVLPPPAILVQRSELNERLSAVGCDDWRAELRGTDPLTGAPLLLAHMRDSLPSVVTLQGGGPLLVRVHCPRLGLILRCQAALRAQSCTWSRAVVRAAAQRPRRRRAVQPQPRRAPGRGQRRMPHPVPATARGPRRIPHTAPYNNNQRMSWEPRRPEAVLQSRSAEFSQSDPASQPPAYERGQPWQRTFSPQVHRAGEEQHAADGAATYSENDHDATYSHPTDTNYPQPYHPNGFSVAPHFDRAVPFTHPAHRRQGLVNPFAGFGQVQALNQGVMLSVFPNFVSCFGGLGGCLLCAYYLESTNSKVPTDACVGPCVVGSSIACSGALATLFKEIVKTQMDMKGQAAMSG